MIVINTTHYKTIKDFVRFCLTFKSERDLAYWFEQDYFTVGDVNHMSNRIPFERFSLWTIAANAFLFKKCNMLSRELQNVSEI